MPRKKAPTIKLKKKGKFHALLKKFNIFLTQLPHKKIWLTLLLGVLITVSLLLYCSHANSDDSYFENEEQEMIAELGAHMLLPNEEPSIYSIDNPSILVEEQPFFTGSEPGDYLIIYPTNGKAIIYSFKRKLIINVGPVTFDTETVLESYISLAIDSDDVL